MNLRCKIEGKIYDVCQGASFSEKYNETLDSATINLAHIVEPINAKPYDDVFIWSIEGEDGQIIEDLKCAYFPYYEYERISDDKCKFESTKILIHKDIIYSSYQKIIDVTIKYNYIFRKNLNFVSDGASAKIRYLATNEEIKLKDYEEDINYFYFDITSFFNPLIINEITSFKPFKKIENGIQKPLFYKHLLIQEINEDIKRLDDERYYNYNIKMFSETKGMEIVQIPNYSLTQPLKKSYGKKTAIKCMEECLELYNPKIKIKKYENDWVYQGKFSLSQEMYDLFSDVYPQDFSLNNPNLRDVFSQLMITKDNIPYVKDNVIYPLDITKRNGTFDKETDYVINGSIDSSDFCDNLKTNYSQAMSQENFTKNVELIGFRNSSNALMTLKNMQLELSFPIYKVKKVYMCYYTSCTVVKNEYGDDYNGQVPKKTYTFLCKQDITKLVKLEQERQYLSQDWDDFETENPLSIDDLAKYKLCTVGYSIGSNVISGWGEMYTYPKGWFDINKSYAENILDLMMKLYPFGIDGYEKVEKEIIEKNTDFDGEKYDKSYFHLKPNYNIIVPDDWNDNIAKQLK